MAFRQGTAILNDLAMAALVIAIVSLMILPLPTSAIDTLLAVNISASVLLLMTTLFIPNAIALSTFPSLLLFTTLFRLSLNIASTKSILLHADAGHLIDAFGEMVVGGNLVVGIIIFLIITIVQFIVISKGSERVAEVGARFTLDAMPGKQMSIDADLRAGLLTGDEAKRKRAHLAMESQMHGGMDGAMKFVKGDTIAGLIITLINLVGGIVVGVMYHGMSSSQAANRFAVLSIGDAMVSQIASLFISVAAGVLITRVSDDGEKKPRSLGQEVGAQLTGNARGIYMASGLVAAFGMVPGFPALQFLMISAGLVASAFVLDKRKRKLEQVAISKPISALQRDGAKGEAPSIRQEPPLFSKPLAVRMSKALGSLLEADALDDAINKQRQILQEHLGLPFPGVAMWVTPGMKGLGFDVLLNDVPMRHVDIPGKLMLLDNVDSPLAARAKRHGPVFDRPDSLWVEPGAVTDATRDDVLSVESVIAHHTIGALRQYAHLFIGVQEVQWVMERVSGEYPGLVTEVQKILPAQRIAEVLRRLLEEQVPVRNVRTILEGLIAWGPKEKDMLVLTEHIRGDLGRYLAHEASAGTQVVEAILMDPDAEQFIRQSIKATAAGNFLAIAPERATAITDQVLEIAGPLRRSGVAMVTSMDIRRYMRKMIEARIGWLNVYSFQELGSAVELRPIGRVLP
jgi:type III secretion protein V